LIPVSYELPSGETILHAEQGKIRLGGSRVDPEESKGFLCERCEGDAG